MLASLASLASLSLSLSLAGALRALLPRRAPLACAAPPPVALRAREAARWAAKVARRAFFAPLLLLAAAHLSMTATDEVPEFFSFGIKNA